MNNTAELIKSRIKISDIVGKHVSLKPKSGGEFVGLCPFHGEKTPSFTVSEPKGFYHCFGCGEHGDIFTFLMKIERMEYKDALQHLAQLAGVTLQKQSKEKLDKINNVYNIYQATQLCYQNWLFENNSDANTAIQYLEKRGFTRNIIAKFGLGFSPNYNLLHNALKGKFTKAQLMDARILNEGSNDSLYDVFAHRVIFPIHDRRGKVIAFGGRLIPEVGASKPNAPKYLNSPETPIFKKSNNLYGLYQCAESIIKQSKAIIVEGYADVISLYQLGVKNAVAPLGTSLKLEHLTILSKLCSEIVVCLDGDAAGRRAMMRFIDLALPTLNPNLKISFAILPNTQDPDDYIRKYGTEAFLKLLDHAEKLADFLFDNLCETHKTDTPEGSTALKEELEKYASKVENAHLSKEYKYYLLQKFWHFTKKGKSNKIHTNITKFRNSLPRAKISAFEELLALIIAHPKLLEKSDIMQTLLYTEIEDKMVDKLRCLVIEWGDYPLDEEVSNEDLHHHLRNFLNIEGYKLEGLDFYVSRFKSTSLDYYNDLAKKILLKHQLQLVSLDIKMLKNKLKDSNSENDFKRYNSLIALRSKLKLNKET